MRDDQYKSRTRIAGLAYFLFRCLSAGLLLTMGLSTALAQPLDGPPQFRQGLEQVHKGNFRQAIAISKAIQKAFPNHPLGPLLAAEAYWGIIYCQTGHITSREVWYEADTKNSPYDREFQQAVDRALQLSRQMRSHPASAAAGNLYSGLAHGARGRLYALRGQSMPSASEGKQMRADLLAAVAKDPALAPDADLGLGSYNYYADALSPILKFFRFFLGIPGGNRAKGIEQLRTASTRSELWKEEAKYELARIYGIREGRHSEAFALFQELARQYPENPVYALSAAYEAEATGDEQSALEYSQKAQDAAAGTESDCRDRMTTVTKAAVQRLQEKQLGRQKK